MKLISVAILASILMWSEPITACLCQSLPDDSDSIASMYADADIVILGTVMEAHVRSWVDGPIDRTEFSASIRVAESFKGVDGMHDIDLWSDASSCSASFDVRKTYLFFAHRSEEDGRHYTGRCKAFLYIPIEQMQPGQSWPREKIEAALTTLRELREIPKK